MRNLATIIRFSLNSKMQQGSSAESKDLLVMKNERDRFVKEEWPKIVQTIERLGLSPSDLLGMGGKGEKS